MKEERKDDGLTKSPDYGKIVENIPKLVFCHNMGGDITYANPYSAERLGYNIDELLKMNIFDLISSDEVKKIQEKKEKRKQGDKSTFQMTSRLQKNDGEVFPVNLSCSPFVNSEGKKEFLVVAQDVSEREKMRDKNDLLYSILRHDVRNKVQIARGYLELLRDVDMEGKGEKFLEKANEAVQNSLELIEKVATLSKISERESRKVNVNRFIKNSKSENALLASENNVEIIQERCDCQVIASPLLEEVFSNLIENSIIHSDCDRVEISSRETEKGCIISVKDNGCGIGEEEKKKIFEKGYKKADSAGSGLGLYLVKEIIEGYGGSVKVEDSDLGGVCFEIFLKKA